MRTREAIEETINGIIERTTDLELIQIRSPFFQEIIIELLLDVRELLVEKRFSNLKE